MKRCYELGNAVVGLQKRFVSFVGPFRGLSKISCCKAFWESNVGRSSQCNMKITSNHKKSGHAKEKHITTGKLSTADHNYPSLPKSWQDSQHSSITHSPL
jgi:hypothetical protein